MLCPKLQNYLRSHRMRCGLSQTEAAFLVGGRSNSKISGYERRGRLPSLKTLFAFEAIYGAPARELFAGLAEQIDKEVAARKHHLAKTWYAHCDKPLPPTGLAQAHKRLPANPKTK